MFNELRILLWIQYHLRSEFLDNVMKFFTTIGNTGLVWIFVAIIMVVVKKTRKKGFLVLLALVLSYIICNLIFKNILMKPRPFEVYKYIDLIIKKPSGYSFPSGHTSSSIAAAYVIYKSSLFYKKINLGYLAFFVAIMISFSRLYLFVHYPSDVLGGILTGIIAGDLAIWIMGKYDLRKYKKML
ncbi:phosphatase PAP2 family protein [Helicovermis profundi]|uniref:phosphatase PAP2 family protein n=1 Tax=Helicovermis profundi TaxID=3065157 RepID=UPI0030CADF48